MEIVVFPVVKHQFLRIEGSQNPWEFTSKISLKTCSKKSCTSQKHIPKREAGRELKSRKALKKRSSILFRGVSAFFGELLRYFLLSEVYNGQAVPIFVELKIFILYWTNFPILELSNHSISVF